MARCEERRAICNTIILNKKKSALAMTAIVHLPLNQ